MDTFLEEKRLVSPEKEQSKLNILIVDDELSHHAMVKDFIEESTIAPQVDLIEMARDGQEAFDIIEKNKGKFNVVLTDGEMPNMNGLDLAKKIKDSREDIKVCLISGGMNGLDLHDSNTQESVKRDYGITSVLPKPFSTDQLSDLLAKITKPTFQDKPQ